ncbi:MAG: type II toxin-antitoxin system VapC family toxin [Dehalococcoidia bacterium]
MSVFYYDSSALVKRYIAELGSGWVRRQTRRDAGHLGFTVVLSGPEIIAAVVRRARGGHLTQRDARRAVLSIRQDWRGLFFVVSVDQRIVNRAMDIAEGHGLRGYDAVHVAAALVIQHDQRARGLPNLSVVSADHEQLTVAAAEGLAVEDPNVHR